MWYSCPIIINSLIFTLELAQEGRSPVCSLVLATAMSQLLCWSMCCIECCAEDKRWRHPRAWTTTSSSTWVLSCGVFLLSDIMQQNTARRRRKALVELFYYLLLPLLTLLVCKTLIPTKKKKKKPSPNFIFIGFVLSPQKISSMVRFDDLRQWRSFPC